MYFMSTSHQNLQLFQLGMQPDYATQTDIKHENVSTYQGV